MSDEIPYQGLEGPISLRKTPKRPSRRQITIESDSSVSLSDKDKASLKKNKQVHSLTKSRSSSQGSGESSLLDEVRKTNIMMKKLV